MGFPDDSCGKESACNAGDSGLIPGSGRSPGRGNGSPLQYSCLENSTDRGAWRDTVHGVAKELDTTELALSRIHWVEGLLNFRKIAFLLWRRRSSWSSRVQIDPLGVIRHCPSFGKAPPRPLFSGRVRSAQAWICYNVFPALLLLSVSISRLSSSPPGLGAHWGRRLSLVHCSWSLVGIEWMRIPFMDREQLRLDSHVRVREAGNVFI